MMGSSTPSSTATPTGGQSSSGPPPPVTDYATSPPTSSSSQLGGLPGGGRRTPDIVQPPTGSASLLGGSAPQQPSQGQTSLIAPLTQTNVGAQNIKYADSNVGSPQDLSTASSGGTPQPGAGPGGLQAPKSPESDMDEPSSPLSPSPSGKSGKGEDVKSNPPQIYPWMKRVHLGQSKLSFFFYYPIFSNTLRIFRRHFKLVLTWNNICEVFQND